MANPFAGGEDLLSSLPSGNRFSNNNGSSSSSAAINANSMSDPFSLFSDSPNPTGSDQSEPRTPRLFDRFDGSSSDDDEGGFSRASSSSYAQEGVVKTAGKKLDYMIQFLDRKLSKDGSTVGNESRPLPEVIGNGGDTGIFRLPVRAAVHPGRPPSLDVRPHPLRETQVGCSLRTLICSDSQLWAGGESGLRFWKFSELYSPETDMARAGDEMSAPFRESVTTPGVVCMVADEGAKAFWTGHLDGKIRCWMLDQMLDGDGFKERLSWQAHRGPVLSMTISSYGTEDGVIKIWTWETIAKCLSFSAEERHMAAITLERAYIDLKNQVTINGVCYMFASDVKYLASDNSTAKVWSAGIFTFAMDARTWELLKVFNTDGQLENWMDMPSAQDMTTKDELKLKFVAAVRKEKSQTSFGFLQKSRNAILGAADAVRRAAVKGAYGEDGRRTEAMVMTIDGMVWTGFTSGLIVRWDENGNRLKEFQHHPYAVQCFCTLGSRIWVGYASGTVQVLDLDGQLLGGWIAHSAPVINMCAGAGYIFTLASHGGVRGWNITSPGPLDNVIRSELSGKEFLYTRLEKLKILAGTWNVAEGRASSDSLISWLGSAASDADMVVVGLQEVEMGAGVLAMSAARESVGLEVEGSSVGQWWLDTIGNILDEGSTFDRVGFRQLAGMLISVWVRKKLRTHVGDVDVAAVPCGFGRAIGNKGAVGLRIRVYDRVMCFVNCHFAAHVEALSRRNADFDHVYRNTIFSRPSGALNNAAGIVPYLLLSCSVACFVYQIFLVYPSCLPLILSIAAGISSAVQVLRGTNAAGLRSGEAIPELSEADMVIFLGDFNYRLHGISYDEARDFISQRCFDWLKVKDQLWIEMEAGRVFQGMREAIVRFPPTYKFERHQPGLSGYDAGEKKRVPAWCDRILYRDSHLSTSSECSLDCPVVGSILQYEACMDVTDSDHKPVRCIFNVDVARVDESIKRQEFGEIMESNGKICSLRKELSKVPETIVSTNNIILQNNDTSILRITNKNGRDKALFTIICEGETTIHEDGKASNHNPRGLFGLPHWLKVYPAEGVIKPDRTAEVSVHHEEFHTQEEYVDGVPQNSWCEDTRDNEVLLAVQIRGSCTTEMTCHRIRVRHCPLSVKKDYNMNLQHEDNLGKVQANILHRSDMQKLNTSLDVFDQLLDLNTP
ncbi:hypothetical protein V2J09_007718 [Rumex salicifolius]